MHEDYLVHIIRFDVYCLIDSSSENDDIPTLLCA